MLSNQILFELSNNAKFFILIIKKCFYTPVLCFVLIQLFFKKFLRIILSEK